MATRKIDEFNKIEVEFEKMSNVLLEQLDTIEQILTAKELAVSDDALQKITANEKLIDEMEVRISDMIVNTIVLQQPVASELRAIIACYRNLINMERIGDLVVNIISFIKKIKTPELYNHFNEIFSSMSILCSKMVRHAILSYIQKDKELAIWTIKTDDILDDVNRKLMKKLLNKADSEEKNKDLLRSMIMINEMMSNIERIADYATNIAEASVYVIEGKDIRHKKPEETEN